MNYNQFYQEVAIWINQANDLAGKHGLGSNTFWLWVTKSTGELCDKYNNNELAIKQMVMLHEWLDEMYYKSKNN